MTDPFCQSLFSGHDEGVFYNTPEAEYHNSAGVSKSRLLYVRQSLGHFRYAKMEPTPAMRLGTMVHGMMLDGKLPGYVIRPDDERGNFRTKVGKEWKAQQEADGLQVVTTEDTEDLRGMGEALIANPIASQMIARSRHEVSVYAKDPTFNLLLRGRVDCLSSGKAICDIKTTATPIDDIGRKVGNLGYDLQAAMYLRICDILKTDHTQFYFIFVETKPPYRVEVFDALAVYGWEDTKEELESMLAAVATAAAKNEWPSSSGAIQPLPIGRFVKRFGGVE